MDQGIILINIWLQEKIFGLMSQYNEYYRQMGTTSINLDDIVQDSKNSEANI